MIRYILFISPQLDSGTLGLAVRAVKVRRDTFY